MVHFEFIPNHIEPPEKEDYYPRMVGAANILDWSITRPKVDEAVRRIVAYANPLKIIAFGSRARGDHRIDSDLDLAVILDHMVDGIQQAIYGTVLPGIRLEVDVIAVSRAEYDLHRRWLNSVYNYIDNEGIVLYDREHPEDARPDALHLSGGRSQRPELRTA